MKGNFSHCLAYVLLSEGGYVNNAADKGGPTNHGITQAVYDAYRKAHKLTTQDVRQIAPIEVEEIYFGEYWQPTECDSLPSGVDYCIFDYAVNSGDDHAERDLQAALKVKVDGKIGPKTLQAAAGADPKALINSICDDRLIYLRHLRNYPTFGKGWDARVASVRAIAEAMAA